MGGVKVTIDGVQIEVPPDTTVLEAAKRLNKLIPTFCYHPKLPIFGGCRICLVYEKRWKTTIIACGTKVYDGMEIETENEEVLRDRKFILEMLFTRHPLDCPICDKAGECDLQNWGTYYGPQVNVTPFTPFDKVRPEEDWESDFLEFVSNRCVLCLRCVSVCKNVVGADALFQEERAFETLISPDKKPMDSESRCEFCGLCVDVCPVGAIIFKPFKFKTRAWLLNETISYCGMCSLNCPVAIDHDGKNIFRIRSTADLQVCSGAYLGYDISNKNRLKTGLINGSRVSLDEALYKIADVIEKYPDETAVIVSPFSGNYSLEVQNRIFSNMGVNVTSTVTLTLKPVLDGFKDSAGKEYKFPEENDLWESEQIIIVGSDVSDTNPVISYFFHKGYFEGSEFGNDKKIIFIGERYETLKKYFPEVITVSNEDAVEKLKDFDFSKKTSVLYSTTSLKGLKAYKAGKILGEISVSNDVSVYILPYERNGFGVLNRVSNLSYLVDVLKDIEGGKIKNILLVGEDLLDHIDYEYMNKIFSYLENIMIITPFEDGLALSSHVAVGSSIWFEEDEEVDSVWGKVKTKSAVRGSLQEKEIFLRLEGNLNLEKVINNNSTDIEYRDFENIFYPEIELWDFSYYSKRSDNLMNIKLKRALKKRVTNS
ncbi:2Fe-2S iron-sulfur cluster-binding protein [Persephonella sp.]